MIFGIFIIVGKAHTNSKTINESHLLSVTYVNPCAIEFRIYWKLSEPHQCSGWHVSFLQNMWPLLKKKKKAPRALNFHHFHKENMFPLWEYNTSPWGEKTEMEAVCDGLTEGLSKKELLTWKGKHSMFLQCFFTTVTDLSCFLLNIALCHLFTYCVIIRNSLLQQIISWFYLLNSYSSLCVILNTFNVKHVATNCC